MKRLTSILAIVFPIYWILFITFQYLSNYPGKLSGIVNLNSTNAQYIFFGLVINWIILKYIPNGFSKKNSKLIITGWKILLCLISNTLLGFLISGSNLQLISSSILIPSSWSLIWKLGFTLISTFTVALSAFAWGDLLLKRFYKDTETVKYYVYSSALGVVTIVYGMFALGAFGILTQAAVSVLLVLPLILNFRRAYWFIKTALWQKFFPELDGKFLFGVCIALLLISYTLLNSFKPFPVGWDSASLYLNISNLIAQNGQLFSGYEAYNWSIFTSIGLIVFNNFPTTLLLSFLGAIWSLILFFDISKKFVGTAFAFLASLLIFTLPSIQFLSFVDQKVDLGFLFFSLTALSAGLDFISNGFKWKSLLLSAIFSGFAFGIKYTAVFLIVGIVSMFSFSQLGLAGAIFLLSSGIALLFGLSVFEVRFLNFNTGFKYSLIAASVISAAVSIFYLFRNKINKAKIITLFKYLLVYGLGILVVFLPWMIFNYSTTQTFSISNLLYGRYNSPWVDTALINQNINDDSESAEEVPETAQIQPIYTGTDEELGRYIGYEKDSFKYLSIFHDTNLGTNVSGHIVDIGFLLLALVPLTGIYLLYKKNQNSSLFIGLIVILIAYLNINFATTAGITDCSVNDFFGCAFANFKQEGVSLNSILGLEFISYLFLPLFWIKTLAANTFLDPFFGVMGVLITNLLLFAPSYFYYQNPKIKAFIIFLFSTLVLWNILGSGVYWYSIVSFCALFVLIILNLKEFSTDLFEIPHGENIYKILKWLIIFWLTIACFGVFQIKSSDNLLEGSFVRYIKDDLNKAETLSFLNDSYAQSVKPINEDEEAKVYKVGSFLYYFIDNNYNRVFQDNQLDVFNNIDVNVNNETEVAEELKKQGFEYIIYDLNTASIDKTPEKTLTKKAEKFEDFLRDNSQLELISTDRIYRNEENGSDELQLGGRTIKVDKKVFGNEKELLRAGSVAVYKIK